jgi:hypothetical protein
MTDEETTFVERKEKLRDITKIQSNRGNADYNAYMHGMANGLILALAIIEDADPKFLEFKSYTTDADKKKEQGRRIMDWLHKGWRTRT